MSASIPDDWPEWPQDELEYLGHCPVCRSTQRSVLHENLFDRWFHAPGRWTMQLCANCGSGYIDPRPNQASIGAAYANYETHRPADTQPNTNNHLATRLRNGYLNTKYGYQMQPASRLGYLAMHLLPPPLRLEWDHYARHLPKPQPGRNKLLDVGCGNGEFLARARWQGWEVHGVDQDETALSHARAAGIPVTHGAIDAALFAPNSFDAITSHQVIEHAHDPIAFLQAAYTWLKPGGRLWLGTPNITSTLHQEFGADWYCLHPPQHLVIFSPQALTTAMSKAGFSKTRLLPRGYLESHIYRQSMQMRETKEIGNWKTFTTEVKQATPLLSQLLLEAHSWLNPSRASDLVAIGQKGQP